MFRSDPHKHAGFYMDYLRGRRYVFAVIPVTVERAFKVSPNISTNPAELYSAMMNTLSAPSIRRYHPTDVEPDTIKALESIQKEWDKQYEMSRVACYHVQRGMLCKFGAKCGQGLRVVVDHMITGDLLFYWAAIKGALQLARAKSVVAGNDEEVLLDLDIGFCSMFQSFFFFFFSGSEKGKGGAVHSVGTCSQAWC